MFDLRKIQRTLTRIAATVLAAALLMQAGAAVPGREAAAATVPQVSLQSGGSVKLTNAVLFPANNHQILYFELQYSNQGSRPIELIDYWAKVLSDDGATFSVQLWPEDKNIATVPAKSTQTVRYFAKVRDGLTMDRLKLQIVLFDLYTENFERPLGTIPLGTVASVTKAGTSRLNEIAGLPVYSKVKDYQVYTGAESTVQIHFVQFNNGRRSLTVPAYKFYVLTANGLAYPLETTGSDPSAVILPKTYRDYYLSGNVAEGVSLDGALLMLVQEIETSTGKIEVAIAAYELAATAPDEGETSGSNVVRYKNKNGQYEISWDRVSRSPWDIQDSIAFTWKIANLGETYIPLPTLTGEVNFDGGPSVPLTFVQNEYETILAPGSVSTVTLYAKVPYQARYNTARVQLREKVSENLTSSIGQFNIPLRGAGLPAAQPVDEPYVTETDGKRTTYEVMRYGVYEGTFGNLLMAQVAVRNDELRTRELTRLAGFFRTKEGQYLAAEVSNMSGPQSAQTKRIVNLWTEIPKTMDVSGMQLVIGEAVANGKFAKGGDVPETMVNSAVFDLPDRHPVKNTASGVEVLPFSLTITGFSAVYDQADLSSNFLTVDIKYRLEKDFHYTNATEDRKINISLEYKRGTKFEYTFSQTLEIAAGTEPGPTSFALGEHELKLTKVYPKNFDFHLMDQYYLNIYEEFKGYKLLIASVPFSLYTRYDWSGN